MKRTHRTDQSGMVALIVTMIMMFVITLIVIGFSEATRRNQREALDTQLGTQAYYAAETGVNDTVNVYKAGETITPTSCGFTTNTGKIYPRSLKTDNSVANTCLIVDSNPTSLIADTIKPNAGSIQWDVKSSSGNAFATLKFAWSKDPSAAGSCSGAFKTYPKPTSWNCTHALVRVDIINANGIGSYDATTLANATKTLYLQPSGSASAGPTLGAPAAYQAACHPGGSGNICSVTVNTGSVVSSEYYVRITSQYVTAKSVTLSGTEASGAVAHFTNGQVVVDSTGRAQDQVKRIRVRVPLTGATAPLPIFAVQGSSTICKDMTVLAATSTYDIGACSPPVWP